VHNENADASQIDFIYTLNIALTNPSQQKRTECFSEVYFSLSTLNSFFISYNLLDTYLHMYIDTSLLEENILCQMRT